jgi:hypothetical protein
MPISEVKKNWDILMKHEEHNIQSQIVEYLEWKNIFFFAVPNGEKRETKNFYSKKIGNFIKYSPAGKRLKQEGVKAGVPDLCILLSNGKLLFIEVKTKIGKQNSNQKEFEKKVKDLGFTYLIWRDVADAENFVKNINNVFDNKIINKIYEDMN